MGDLAQIFTSSMFFSASDKVAEAVRHDGTVMAEHAETPGHSFWEEFARSTAAMAGPAAGALDGLLAPWFAGRDKVRVLDIAAGSGLYGFTLASRPNVHLTSLDWPNVLVETRRWAARAGVDPTRVRYIEGNLFEVDYQGPYDLILLSHVYHLTSTRRRARPSPRRWARRWRRAAGSPYRIFSTTQSSKTPWERSSPSRCSCGRGKARRIPSKTTRAGSPMPA